MEEISRQEILRGKALTDALLIGWFYITATFLFHSHFFFEGWNDLPGQGIFAWKGLVVYVGVVFWAVGTLGATYRIRMSFKEAPIRKLNSVISFYGPCVIGLITTIFDVIIFILY